MAAEIRTESIGSMRVIAAQFGPATDRARTERRCESWPRTRAAEYVTVRRAALYVKTVIAKKLASMNESELIHLTLYNKQQTNNINKDIEIKKNKPLSVSNFEFKIEK